MDIQERLTAFAMLGAGWVMWLLVGLSIVGLAIVLERAYAFFATREDSASLRKELQRLLAEGDIGAVGQRLAKSKSFEAKIVGAGVDVAYQGKHAIAERLDGEAVVARAAMERNLAFLGTVGNNAPFVGLLGTVIGIIRAFAALNQDSMDATGAVIGEVGEALVATAIGLLVALPAVVFYNWFQRIIRGRMVWADAMGKDLLAHVSGSAPAKAAAATGPANAGEAED